MKTALLVLLAATAAYAEFTSFGTTSGGDYSCGGSSPFIRYTLFGENRCYQSDDPCDVNRKYGASSLNSIIHAPQGIFEHGEVCVRLDERNGYGSPPSTASYYLNGQFVCTVANLGGEQVKCCPLPQNAVRMGAENFFLITTENDVHIIGNSNGLQPDGWCSSNTGIKIAARISFEYRLPNTPPSKPSFTSPENQTEFDTPVLLAWTQSDDEDGDNVNYTIRLDGQTLTQGLEALEYSWDSSQAPEGTHLLEILAFDGKEYSSPDSIELTLKHIFHSQPEQTPAFAGVPVEWAFETEGSGIWTCSKELPEETLAAAVHDSDGNEVESSLNENQLAWECDLNLHDYSASYYTTPVELNASSWVNRTRFMQADFSLHNPTAIGYRNVAAQAECIEGLECNATGFSVLLLNAGETVNFTINAEFPEEQLDGETEVTNETVEIIEIPPELNVETTPTEVQETPYEFGAVEIMIPDEIAPGLHSVGVFKNGVPQNGSIEMSDRYGSTFERQLHDGVVEFYFDTLGAWRIKYQNTVKEVKVAKPIAKEATPESEIKAEQHGKATGLAWLNHNYLAGIPIVLLAVGFAALRKKAGRLSAKRIVKNGRAEITVENTAEDLTEVTVTQFVPEKTTSNYSAKPKVTETVTGDLLEWKFKTLEKGGRISIAFDLKGELQKPLDVIGLKNGKKTGASAGGNKFKLFL